MVFISAQNRTRYDPETDRLIKRFGRKLKKLADGEETEFYGFIQPLRYKNKMYLNGISTELGYNTTKKYLLISQADVKLKQSERENVIITATDGKYCCDHSETVCFGEKECYCWSIIHRISY